MNNAIIKIVEKVAEDRKNKWKLKRKKLNRKSEKELKREKKVELLLENEADNATHTKHR